MFTSRISFIFISRSGKGESIWDYMTHLRNQNFIYDQSNADVAADSYHNYKKDIKLAKQIGVSDVRN